MPKITPDEYEALKAFYIAWMPRFFANLLTPETDPATTMAALEKISMSKARVGLGQAINDIIEMSWSLRPEEITEVDRDFAARGIVTLSELRRRYSRQFRGVLKRGTIRNETEYYLIRGVLDSGTADATHEELTKLHAMTAAYEKSLPNNPAG